VSYAKHDRPSPAISLRSLPELETVAINKYLGSTPNENSDYVGVRTRRASDEVFPYEEKLF
jgi:hypothetical protein